MLRETVKEKLDIFLIRNKFRSIFPSRQFLIGFSSLFELDSNSSGDDIMLYLREEIPSKFLIEYKSNSPVVNIFIETNLRPKKWLVSCS